MKLQLTQIAIWLKNGNVRTISFAENKVNVITGDSNTGKTAILDIFDYCLLSSRHKISESMINEHVSWYGIRTQINNKTVTIARAAPKGANVSPNYYFSSLGEVPEKAPDPNITESALRTFLDTEFGIDQETTISYGGKSIKAGSKVSFRYLLMFNTISQDIITDSEQFFDKQGQPRYREALPRIFDLAVGIETTTNMLKREKREELEKRLRTIERESQRKKHESDLFQTELSELTRKCKSLGLVPEEFDSATTVNALGRFVAAQDSSTSTEAPTRYEELAAQISSIGLKIRNLKRFQSRYRDYQATLRDTDDSLQTLNYLRENYGEILEGSALHDILSELLDQQAEIRARISKKTPIDSNTSDLIRGYEAQKKGLEKALAENADDLHQLGNLKEKYIFIGEVKAKLHLYAEGAESQVGKDDLIAEITKDLGELGVDDVEERRRAFIDALNETIDACISIISEALDNYGTYKSSFNYRDKKLSLRKPRSMSVENIGSSSNHMFLHLLLFLGLHEMIIANKSPHIPQFLVIDQLSRPYWGESGSEGKELRSTDIFKVKSALTLLNSFVNEANKKSQGFQVILFEHIPEDLWNGLDMFELSQDFKGGNALIPESLL